MRTRTESIYFRTFNEARLYAARQANDAVVSRVAKTDRSLWARQGARWKVTVTR